jgi:hypothetical protein
MIFYLRKEYVRKLHAQSFLIREFRVLAMLVFFFLQLSLFSGQAEKPLQKKHF